MLLLISLFMVVSICLLYWGDPMFGPYKFIIFIYSSWIDSLITMLCMSLSILTVFTSKSILFHVSIATPAFLWFGMESCDLELAWNTFFHWITFNLYAFLGLSWVPCRQHIYRSCICVHSISVYLLFGAFNPVSLKKLYQCVCFYCHFLNCFVCFYRFFSFHLY